MSTPSSTLIKYDRYCAEQFTNMRDRLDYYVGLDQALLNTGVAMCQPHAKQIVVRTLVTDSKCSIYERLFEIEREIDWVTSLQETLHVWLEKPFTPRGGASRKTALDLIRVETIITNLLYRKNSPFDILDSSPRAKKGWPKTLGILGTKSFMQTRIYAFSKAKVNQHEADAIGILWAGLVQSGIVLLEDLDTTEIIKVEKVCRPLSATAD